MEFSEELKFPCIGHYKIIAENTPDIKQRLEKRLHEIGIMNPLTSGNHSTNDRYITFNVDILINTKEYMYEVDKALRAVPGVKMVL